MYENTGEYMFAVTGEKSLAMMIQNHRAALRAAIEREALPAAIDALVGIAQNLVEARDSERALEILTLVLYYPMNRETREVAETLYDDLEATVCPRLLLDARTLALSMTLDDLAHEEISKIEF